MAETDVEIIPGESEQPPPEVVPPEEATNSGPSGGFAYWKTYPGIWKILHVIFGVISLICIIICFIPEWTWSDWSERGTKCPKKWIMELNPENGGYYFHAKIEETKKGQVIYHRQSRRNTDGDTEGPFSISDTKREQQRWDQLQHYEHLTFSKGEAYYKNKKILECYGSLTFPYGTLGWGRHDIWLYAWTVTIICGFVADIVIILFQIRDSNFVNRTKRPLEYYYQIIGLAQELPAIWMTMHIVRNITLPRAAPCLVAALCTLINLVFYLLSYYWSNKRRAP